MEKIVIGAYKSPLSQAKLLEVQKEILAVHPNLEFESLFLEPHGDQDLNASKQILDKTDFFTREIDELLLSGKCRIAIHSVTDLPDPIPEGIVIAAITKGVDPSDSLVLRPGDSLESLSPGAIIATSSERCEEAIRQLRSDIRFVNLRGTINQRLKKLQTKEADGVIVAEAVLIRLGLTQLNRVRVPGDGAKAQGQLAVLARSGDKEMLDLFSAIDQRLVKIV